MADFVSIAIALAAGTCDSGLSPGSDAGSPLSSPAVNLLDPNFLERQLGVDNHNKEEEERGQPTTGGPFKIPWKPICREGLKLLCCFLVMPDGESRICFACEFVPCLLPSWT